MSKSRAAYQSLSGRSDTPRRVRRSHVEWVAERLSKRDSEIIEAVNRLRQVSSQQLERLFFTTLAGHARSVVRGRVLRRLVRWQVLSVLPRRIGGAARGSAGTVYALGPTGVRLCAERQATITNTVSVRRSSVLWVWNVRHTLAVSELYVSLVESAQTQDIKIVVFATEPACWWPNGLGGFLKPDAYTALAWGAVREHWWIEVDLATESLPTLKRKLLTYLNFVERGQLGPGNLVPRVLVTTPTLERCRALQVIMTQLPAPAADLFSICTNHESAILLLQSLQE